MINSTGISTKVFAGLQQGMETVTTPAGTRGLESKDGCPHLHVAEPQAAPFAQAILSAVAKAGSPQKPTAIPPELTMQAVSAKQGIE